ncbi:hypothetical protein Ancab_010048 [Ancistrocladus abbreviatus]
MAVKFGKAFGLNLTVLNTSSSKKDDAPTLFGADRFVVSKDEEQMKASAKSFDFIIDTASVVHPLDPYLLLLKPTGIFVIVAAPSEMKFNPIYVIMGMCTIAGTTVGGTEVTQELLNFFAANKIYPLIEKIPMDCINEAYERIMKRILANKHSEMIDKKY